MSNVYSIGGQIILIDGKLAQEPPPPSINFRLLSPATSSSQFTISGQLNEVDDISWRRNSDGMNYST